MSFTNMKSIGVVLLAGLLLSPGMLPVRAATTFAPQPLLAPQQADQASAALHEGRRLLKRGRADQALIQLRNALNLYTAA